MRRKGIRYRQSTNAFSQCSDPDALQQLADSLTADTALDRIGERLLDANRTIGQPNKLTIIFGRKITKYYNGKLQTVIGNLPKLRQKQSAIIDRYLDVQQDILVSFIRVAMRTRLGFSS